MRYMVILFCFLAGVTQAWAQDANYRLQPGDTLQIEVLEDPQLNRSLLVLPDGTINFPFAGSVRAGGRTVDQLQSTLVQALEPQFAAAPTVFVSVGSLRPTVPATATGPAAAETIDIYVLGEVNSPGGKALEPGVTFLQALSQSGGLTPFAATKRVQLRRTDPATGRQTVTSIDYRAITRGAELTRSIVLQDGDVILVPERRLFE